MSHDPRLQTRPTPDAAPNLGELLRSVQAERRCSVEEALEIIRRDHSDQVNLANRVGHITTRG